MIIAQRFNAGVVSTVIYYFSLGWYRRQMSPVPTEGEMKRRRFIPSDESLGYFQTPLRGDYGGRGGDGQPGVGDIPPQTARRLRFGFG